MSKSLESRSTSTTPFYLFAYGTLLNPMVFRAVLGYRLVARQADADGASSFHGRDAVLPGYRKISPDGMYLYAVPDEQGRIRGCVTGPLPAESMAALKRYEGKNYQRVQVKVLTADGPVRAVAFVGRDKELSHAFGWAFRDPLKQEVLLRDRIDQILLADEISQLHTDEELTRKALWELHGLTIRDLIRQHFDSGGISKFAIQQAIRDEPLRDFPGDLATDPGACQIGRAYLTMVLRQVMFNQIEDRLRDDLRYDLDRMGLSNRFYERTVSALCALRLLNARGPLVAALVDDILGRQGADGRRLIDYVREGVIGALKIYDPADAAREIRFLRAHMGGGAIPLGAELEFSNTGHDVIADPSAHLHHDRQYDGFLYFRDYGLDILTWKLGGHLDDHRVKTTPQRRRGFFELALGSLSVEANISKPITNDPWLLNQFIHAVMRFYDVAPHSLHISLQLRSPNRPTPDRPLPLSVMKCLFALSGDPEAAPGGGIRVSRLAGEEILRKEPATHMLFSDTSRRRSSDEEESGMPASRGRWVQQFKFLRLSPRYNYEPIIMALKGLQIHYTPGSFLTAQQYQSNPKLAELFARLRAWGCNADRLSAAEIEEFLSGVYQGLMCEHRGKPAHSTAYIAYCLSRLRDDLAGFNRFAEAHGAAAPKRTATR
ncbi:MAG TPA: gamma-glutamylcyclotransferase family protein [Phycisphaerae bacterium]|nr:gamma-glutamylcyclotransferase family protein [Phycisphaerae bacterium]